MVKISILVPCCNVEQYVRECLNSIKNQTYTNLEVICIDDGSKDKTGSIIDEFVAADSRFKVIHKPNSGYGDSMNKGLEMCTGEYIGIIESDDWIEPDMFETLLKTAIDNDLDMSRCCWYEGPTGTEAVNAQDLVLKNVVLFPLEHEGVFLQQSAIWASLYRRDLLEEGRKVRFLPTPGASYQDTSFAFKTYSKSRRFMMIDRPLHHYRVNPGSSVMSSSKANCIIDEWEEMRRWICEDERLHDVFSKRSLFVQICYHVMLWNYRRVSDEAIKMEFLQKSCEFFRKASKDGIINLRHLRRRDAKDISVLLESSPSALHDRLQKRTVSGKLKKYRMLTNFFAGLSALLFILLLLVLFLKY